MEMELAPARLLMAAASLSALGCVASPVSAASFTAYDLLDSFNAITSGNLTTSSETEGAVLVGGTLGPGSGGLDNKSTAATLTANVAAVYAPISVYGNASGSWTVTAGDAVHIAGTNSGTFANSGSVLAGASFSASASSVQQLLSGLSTSLAAQTSTPIAPDVSHTLTFNGAQNGSTDYFSISLSDLATATSVGFNLGTGSSEDTAVINVTGTGDLAQAFNFIGTVDPSHILWNFEGATTMELTGFEGSIVALNAAVTNSSAVNGTLAVASFDGSGELHSHSFTGNQPPSTPTSPPTPPPTSIPEPGTMGVFAIGLLGLVGCRAVGRRARAGRAV